MNFNNFDEAVNAIFDIGNKAEEVKPFGVGPKIMKLQEELGELATDHLKIIGYKVCDDKLEDIQQNMKEECVDIFVMVLDVMRNLGMTKEEAFTIIGQKLEKWQTKHIDGYVAKQNK